jgi:hypothetical protein
LRAPIGVLGEHRRALEERGRRRDASTPPRPASRALELAGDALVMAECGLGTMPRAAVGITLGISGRREGEDVPVYQWRRQAHGDAKASSVIAGGEIVWEGQGLMLGQRCPSTKSIARRIELLPLPLAPESALRGARLTRTLSSDRKFSTVTRLSTADHARLPRPSNTRSPTCRRFGPEINEPMHRSDRATGSA